jgi:nucleoside-diphosphate-sugar epimerase
VVITGAGGFVGGWLARALAAREHEVIAVYRSRLAEETRCVSGISLVQGDLAAAVSLPKSFDAVIHCAADIPGLCPDNERLTHSNTTGAEHLFMQARDAGARSIVSLSSMSVYGNISVPVVTEDLSPDNPDAYGLSKLVVENLLDQVCADGAIHAGLSIRLPGTVGRGSHHNFLSATLETIFSGRPIQINHPEAMFNNIVFVGHLCNFVEQWIAAPRAGHSITNIAAREPISIREVINLLYQFSGAPEKVSWAEEGKPSFLIDLSYAQSLGYEPATVSESLKAFVHDCLPSAHSTVHT